MAENVDLDKVLFAYEELVRKNEKVTADKILALTGGSKSTVVKYLRQVRDKVEQKQGLLAEELGFSPEFINAFNRETYRYTTETKKRFQDLLEQAKDSEMFAILALQESEDNNTDYELLVIKLKQTIKEFEEKNKVEIAERRMVQEQYAFTLKEKDEEIRELSLSRDHALKELAKHEIRLEDNDKLAAKYSEELTSLKDGMSKLQRELNDALTNNARSQEQLFAANDKIKSVDVLRNELSKDKEQISKQFSLRENEFKEQILKLNSKLDDGSAKYDEKTNELMKTIDELRKELSEVKVSEASLKTKMDTANTSS